MIGLITFCSEFSLRPRGTPVEGAEARRSNHHQQNLAGPPHASVYRGQTTQKGQV